MQIFFLLLYSFKFDHLFFKIIFLGGKYLKKNSYS